MSSAAGWRSCAPVTCSGRSGDPVRAKAVVDDAALAAETGDRTYIDAFLVVYWFATDRPDLAVDAANALVVEELPPVVGAEVGGCSPPSQRTPVERQKRSSTRRRDMPPPPALWMLRTCDSTSPTPTSARCCCPAGSPTPRGCRVGAWAGADLPGAAQLLEPESPAAPHSARADRRSASGLLGARRPGWPPRVRRRLGLPLSDPERGGPRDERLDGSGRQRACRARWCSAHLPFPWTRSRAWLGVGLPQHRAR